MKVTFLIDGFNFYYSIKRLNRQLRWFDYKKFCLQFLLSSDTLHSIYYFSAIAHWNPETAKRHEVFIEALKTQDINTVLGEFKQKQRYCKSCGNCYIDHEEKQTDVNIALYAYRLATNPEINKIIFISADSDLIPAVKLIKQDFYKKKEGIIFPINRKMYEIRRVSNFTITTKMKHLINCQLPDQIISQSNKILTRQKEWF
jgi:uncharacterized LabA/DUF88 family protein